MIITYIRSSSYGTHDFCPIKYFIDYGLGWHEKPNLKAVKGTMVHKVMEILAKIKKAKQDGQPFVTDELGLWSVDDIDDLNIDSISDLAFNYYQKHEKHLTFTEKDREDVRDWVNKTLNFGNGAFDPRRANIVAPERAFDIEIKQPWAKFDYRSRGHDIVGNLAIKGTIDLTIEPMKGIYEVVDYKTGRRLNWATGAEKDLAALKKDFQLRLYHYAIHALYPEINQVIVTIYFINDGGPFTVNFDNSDLAITEQMIKAKYETIKHTTIPKQNITWKCSKLCSFYKESFAGKGITPIPEFRRGKFNQKGETMCMCSQVSFDVERKGIDRVIEQYTRPGHKIDKYHAPGAVDEVPPVH